MYTIYALLYDSGRIYIGMSNNLQRRLSEHRRGKTQSTKNRGNFRVLCLEECLDRKSARKKELYWKSGTGREQIGLWGRSSVG